MFSGYFIRFCSDLIGNSAEFRIHCRINGNYLGLTYKDETLGKPCSSIQSSPTLTHRCLSTKSCRYIEALCEWLLSCMQVHEIRTGNINGSYGQQMAITKMLQTEQLCSLCSLSVDHLHRLLYLMHKFQQVCALPLPTPELFCTNLPFPLLPAWQQSCNLMDTRFYSFTGGLLLLWSLQRDILANLTLYFGVVKMSADLISPTYL